MHRDQFFHRYLGDNFLKFLMVMGFALIAVALISGCANTSQDAQLRATIKQAGISQLNPGPVPSPQLVELGEMLFFEKEISGNRDISCATCHHPLLHSSDGLALSIGVGGRGLGNARTMGEEKGFIPRNAPDIFNRGAPEWFSMFRDSRVTGNPEDGFMTPAGDNLPDGLHSVLAAQAMFPPTSDAEMRGLPGELDVNGNSNELSEFEGTDFPAIWGGIMDRLLAIPEYVALFNAAYPDIPTDQLGFQHAANAIAAFEISAFTFLDSPWDMYLAGDDSALTAEEKRGAEIFYGEGRCSRCHSGSLFTDQLHHNVAIPQLGPGKGDESPFDHGRARETGNEIDMFAFRTPPLRNVALTGPYMHNGAYNSLEDAVRHMLNPEVSVRNYDPSQLHPMLQGTVMTDPGLINELVSKLDPLIKDPVSLTDAEFSDLIAFLNALTSPSAMDLRDNVPVTVPSGLPVRD